MPAPSSAPVQALLGPSGPSDGGGLPAPGPGGPISPFWLTLCPENELLVLQPVLWLSYPLLLPVPVPVFCIGLVLLLFLSSVPLLHHLLPLVLQQEGGL